MKRYLENKIAAHIQSLVSRLLGKLKFTAVIQKIRLANLLKLELSSISIKNNIGEKLVEIDSAICKLQLWKSIVQCKIVGKLYVEKTLVSWKAIAENEIHLNNISLVFSMRKRKADMCVEIDEATLLLHFSNKKKELIALAEISANWDCYISLMKGNLCFDYLRNFSCSTPVIIDFILKVNKNNRSFPFTSAKISWNDFALRPIQQRDISSINKQLLLDYLYARMESKTISVNYVSFDQIPSGLIWAVNCTEDHNFWTHRGVDPSSFGYAIALNMKNKRFERGASTITMQLVRNLFLNQDKNLCRKVEECVISLLLENYYKISKQDILELYVNIIEFAPNVYGLYNVSLFYFEKQYTELSLTELITLTYIIPRPKHFYDALLLKTNQLKKNLHNHIRMVASMMFKNGMISDNDYHSIYYIINFASQFGDLILSDETIKGTVYSS